MRCWWENGATPERDHGWVDVGQDDHGARTAHPGELGDHRFEPLHVGEGQRAHDHVDGLVVDGQGAQVTQPEVARRNLGLRHRQHRLVEVNPDDLEAPLLQVRGMAAGPTRSVEGYVAGRLGQEVVHLDLVRLNSRVRLVVARRPSVVPPRDPVFDQRHNEIVRELVQPVDDGPNVIETRTHRRRCNQAMPHGGHSRNRREVLRGQHLLARLGHAATAYEPEQIAQPRRPVGSTVQRGV